MVYGAPVGHTTRADADVAAGRARDVCAPRAKGTLEILEPAVRA